MVKVPKLVAVPARFVRVIFPVTAPAGTLTLIETADTTAIGSVTLTPPNFTSVAIETFAPLIVTSVPARPLAGVKELIVGGLITTKFSALVVVPSAVVTMILPVIAVAGTVAVI
jgi:hypothetical protein